MENLKRYSWSLYALILLCLIMPFATISCGSQKVISLSGVQLITGTTINSGGQSQKMQPSIYMIGMCLSTVIGLLIVAGGKNTKFSFKTGAVTNIVSAILLLLYKMDTDNSVIRDGQGMLSVTYENGFWVTLFLSIVTLIIMTIFINSEHTGKQANT